MNACPRCGLAHPAESTCPIAGALPPPRAAPLPLWAVVGGRFEVDAVTHRSGMSTVYRATDLRNPGTAVALKESHTAGLADAERAESLAWLAREAALLSTLSHPGLPRLLAASSEVDRHYVAMPFLTGETLEERVQREGPQPEALVLAWGRALAALLSHLHGQDPPVIHRDLKPANILLRPDGSLVLLDLGVARRVAREGHGVVPGTAVGTPGYAAPEQYQGLADERSDLYSLGATLHRLLTAYQPDDETPFRHPPLHHLAPDASPETEALLARLLELVPERRATSATATLRLLDTPIRATYKRAYRPLRRMYAEVLALLPTGLALSELLYLWRYGPPAGRGAYRIFDAVGDSLTVLLVFLPMLLPLLPLLRPELRALARRDPLAALHRRWTATLLACCWALPLLTWLLSLYRARWGTVTVDPGIPALALALCSAALATIGVSILRLALAPRRLPPRVPRRLYLVAAVLIAAWLSSSLARTPALLSFCYVTSSQAGGADNLGGTPSLAADRRGNMFILDQYSLQERTPDGVYHPLLNSSQINDPAAGDRNFDSLAVAADGSLILGAPGDPSLYQLSSTENIPGVIATLPGEGLPQYASLATGPGATLYYNDLDRGAILRVAGTLSAAIVPKPASPGWRPAGLALDPQGNMYTIEANSGTLERIAPDGSVRALAHIPLAWFDSGQRVTLSRADDGSFYAADGVSLVHIATAGSVQLLNTTDSISQAVAADAPAAVISATGPLLGPPSANPAPQIGNTDVHCAL